MEGSMCCVYSVAQKGTLEVKDRCVRGWKVCVKEGAWTGRENVWACVVEGGMAGGQAVWQVAKEGQELWGIGWLADSMSTWVLSQCGISLGMAQGPPPAQTRR